MDRYQECSLPATPMIRYTAAPTKYDLAPYGTSCIVHLNDDGTDRMIYVQTSKDEHNPNWMPIQDLICHAYKPLFDNPCFIQECLDKL